MSEPTTTQPPEAQTQEARSTGLEMVLMELAKFARALGKMEGMLTQSLSISKTLTDRVKVMEETDSEQSERLAKLEAISVDHSRALHSLDQRTNVQGGRIVNIEKANASSKAWFAGAAAVIGIMGSILGPIGVAWIKHYLSSNGGQ